LKIRELYLRNYRNYSEKKYTFEPCGAILTGQNGSGKTNLLEAIAYFAHGKSVLGLKDQSLIRFSEEFFRITGTFESEKNNKRIFLEAAVDKEKKVIKLDKNLLKRISELYPILKSIYFSPQDINLIEGFPAKRRAYIDFAISQIHYDYVHIIRNYNRIVQQRNALLKHHFDPEEKKTWDEEFISYAAQITDFRLSYLKRLSPVVQKKYQFISNDKEKIELQYQPSFLYNANDYANELREKLSRNENAERKNERTMFGPHLADIHFGMNNVPIRSFGSQGQKRCLAIALSLAQAELIEQSHWGYPILIFDDVLAALDDERTQQSIKLLRGQHQIFIATPHREQYESIDLPVISIGA
jgi:DNA replication and repair protein RecF